MLFKLNEIYLEILEIQIKKYEIKKKIIIEKLTEFWNNKHLYIVTNMYLNYTFSLKNRYKHIYNIYCTEKMYVYFLKKHKRYQNKVYKNTLVSNNVKHYLTFFYFLTFPRINEDYWNIMKKRYPIYFYWGLYLIKPENCAKFERFSETNMWWFYIKYAINHNSMWKFGVFNNTFLIFKKFYFFTFKTDTDFLNIVKSLEFFEKKFLSMFFYILIYILIITNFYLYWSEYRYGFYLYDYFYFNDKKTYYELFNLKNGTTISTNNQVNYYLNCENTTMFNLNNKVNIINNVKEHKKNHFCLDLSTTYNFYNTYNTSLFNLCLYNYKNYNLVLLVF